MLFNSYEFLLLFLPLTALGYFLLARVRTTLAAGWLALASLFFYGYWDYHYVPLLLASVAFNFVIGGRIHAASGTRRAKPLLILGVAVDLALLGYFKYADFFLGSVAALFHDDVKPLGIILPLGISFFTFTQIAYLVDSYKGKAQEYNATNYLLFVTYFPHLIAGPILHHREMMPQFASPETYRLRASKLCGGRCDLRHRPRQEGPDRRQPVALRQPVVQRPRRSVTFRRMGRRTGLHVPALLRFFGLLGHGHWPEPDVRRHACR